MGRSRADHARGEWEREAPKCVGQMGMAGKRKKRDSRQMFVESERPVLGM